MTDSFEGNLAALRPAPASVDRASFYFRAGQASRDPRVRIWQCIAGSALALLIATVCVGFGRFADAEARATEAEAQRTRNPIVIRVPAEVPPAPSPNPIDSEDDDRPYAPPMSPGVPESEPTAAELAATLELRRNILTAGTTYLDSQSRKTR